MPVPQSAWKDTKPPPKDEPAGLQLKVDAEFEECLEFSWQLEDHVAKNLKNSVVEMVIDRSRGASNVPPADAMVKKVDMGRDTHASLKNMPEGRSFFIAVAGILYDNTKVRSKWVHAATLDPKKRDQSLGNLDPMGRPRLACKTCPCASYVALKWTQFVPADKLKCRRCGCRCDDHAAVEITDILRAREEKFREIYDKQKHKLTFLPNDALDWDDRECALWFSTNGDFHPRTTVGEFQALPPESNKGPGGPYGLNGKKGRVSVVTPTTETRHKFHETLWQCFSVQAWPDKELVVVETYHNRASEFFQTLAKKDSRVVYIKFKRPRDEDWSIGTKRNIGAHVASGEFIANFDDDDLYAPSYLTTMIGQIEMRKSQAITLSSWFVFNNQTNKWGYCDAVAWGLAQGMDSTSREVRSWAYGYGFSYVNRRRASLEVPYDDVNMGEDFSFVTRLQMSKTESCVQLYHDDFGICLHLQHGQNTSETFPIHEVSAEDAADLDIAELASVVPLVGNNLKHLQRGARGRREVCAYTPAGTFYIKCDHSTTVEKFLDGLKVDMGTDACDMKVHRVPPVGRVTDDERVDIAAKVLGVVPLMEKIEKQKGELAADKKVRRRELMLKRVKAAMRAKERIPLRTSELWLARPDEGAEAEAPSQAIIGIADTVEISDTDDRPFTVEVTCQSSDVKNYLTTSRTLQVMLPEGSSVGDLRSVIGKDMPPTSKVLSKDRYLQDADPVPQQVTISEFKGRRTLYCRFSQSQCGTVLRMLKVFAKQPAIKQKLSTFKAEAKGQKDEERTYRIRLSQLLMAEAYPGIFRYYNMPCDGVDAAKMILSGLDLIDTDLSLIELSCQVEHLLGNASAALSQWNKVQERRKSLGLPPWEPSDE